MSRELEHLLTGFEAFRIEHFEIEPARMRELAESGQRPKVLVVACSDSRTDPAILTRARPGDLFIVRNVAALVPAYLAGDTAKGTSSAIEFGVRGLEVEDIVVLGHAQCGGIGLLAEGGSGAPGRFEFVGDWVERAAAARDAVERSAVEGPAKARALELATVATSLGHLLTFPWVRERVEAGRLALHGWYFDLQAGRLLVFDPARQEFVVGDGRSHPLVGPGVNPPDLARVVASTPDAAGSSAPER